MTQRRFLLLQGPMGPFFKKLASRLRRDGHSTLRINFNGGDRWHFCSRYAMDYTGTLEAWPAYVRALALQQGITDVLLYGDCRPLHRAAIEVLQPLGVRVHVFEEGYFRPHWITLEENGVNARSALPRDAESFLRYWSTHEATPKIPAQPVGGTFQPLALRTFFYYMFCLLLAPRYRHYTTHRVQNYQVEGLVWLLRLLAWRVRNQFALRAQHRILAARHPYFLVLLQLQGDSQITHHSNYHDMYEFLNEVLNDFARHAPAQAHVVIKNHPLDNGMARYGAFLRQKAHSLGLRGRLHYLDGGHLPSLLESATGVVTVNSTAGLSAVHHHIPTHLRGDAVYALDGLVDRQPLASFWHHPVPPNHELYRAFRRYVIEQTQCNGGFYTRQGVELALEHTLHRLLGHQKTVSE